MRTLLLCICCASLGSWSAMAQSKHLNAADRTFLKMAAQSDMTEAHLGQVAQEQASESDVKDFGRKLIDDHTDAYRELQALASKIGEEVPKGIDIAKNRGAEQLVHLKGKQFRPRLRAPRDSGPREDDR